MKVAHVIIGLEVGGAELTLNKVVRCHQEYKDISHIIISLTDLGSIGNDLQVGGIKVYSLGLKSIFNVLLVSIRLFNIFRHEKPDIVHTWMYHADLLGGLVARAAGVRKIVWCIRSTDISKGGSRFTLIIRRICTWLSYILPTKIICAARSSLDFHSSIGYRADRLEIIPNGFDSVISDDFFVDQEVVRDRLGLSSKCNIVISVGRFNPVKDHRTLIKAAAELVEMRSDVKFLLVGRRLDNSNQELIDILKRADLMDFFYLFGERDDVLSCLDACDVFCLHSVTEGFPNVLGEAMSRGLPCVATDVGDARFLINDNDWVVPPSDPHQLALKLNAVLSLPLCERSAIGRQNIKRIQDDFSITVIGKRYYQLYSDLKDSS